MKRLLIVFAMMAILSFSGSVFAASDVPGALIVIDGDKEWAYANPCPATGCPAGNGVLGLLDYGWAVASAADWLASSWSSNADVNAAFAGKCAAEYFDDNSGYGHCDNHIGFNNPLYNSPFTDNDGQYGYDETFVVRQAAVPEPASMILLGTGLAAVLVTRKRKA